MTVVNDSISDLTREILEDRPWLLILGEVQEK